MPKSLGRKRSAVEVHPPLLRCQVLPPLSRKGLLSACLTEIRGLQAVEEQGTLTAVRIPSLGVGGAALVILSMFNEQMGPTDENRKHLVQYAVIRQGAFKR